MLVLLAPGCGASQDPDRRTPAEVIEAVLEHCHGGRRGTFDRSVFLLRESTDDAGPTFTVRLPESMRVDETGGAQLIVRGGEAWRWRAGVEPRALEGAELAGVLELRANVGAMFLLPLYEARETTRTGPRRLRLRTESGTEWELEYSAEDTPVALTEVGGSGVRFVSHIDTGVTRIPEIVEIGDLGERSLHVIETKVRLSDRTFALPNEKSIDAPDFVIGSATQPRAAEFQEVDACSWLVFDDPGGWRARKEACEEPGRRLWKAGRINAGDPILFDQEGEARMAIAFRAADGREQQPFAPAGGDRVVEHPKGLAAVVMAPKGPFEQRIARGRELLDALIAAHAVEVTGPLRVAVNLYYEADLDAHPEALTHIDLRLELPVEGK